MASRTFGEVEGVQEGDWFEDRKELSRAGIHRPRQAGICGGKYEGAESIVLSGGYEDDADFGDRIIYTGHGGNVPGKATQFKDQEMDLQNQALVVNCEQKIPVRVIRGAKHRSRWSPEAGYVYSGLFRVIRWWERQGKSGFRVFQFELVRVGSPLEAETLDLPCNSSKLPN
jgi:putative restriction endonuclease